MTGIVLAAWLGSIGLTAAAVPPRAPTASPTTPSCTCATAEATNGWCELHGVGYIATVRIRSKLLYEILDAHGHVLDLATFTCPSCLRAIESDGYCEEHKIGFVRKQAYFSRLTYELGKGETRDPAKIVCPVCRKNARSHGWCEKHKVGMIGRAAIGDRASYQYLERMVRLLQGASTAADRCIDCAMGILYDLECPTHGITYKDGKPVARAHTQPSASGSK